MDSSGPLYSTSVSSLDTLSPLHSITNVLHTNLWCSENTTKGLYKYEVQGRISASLELAMQVHGPELNTPKAQDAEYSGIFFNQH